MTSAGGSEAVHRKLPQYEPVGVRDGHAPRAASPKALRRVLHHVTASDDGFGPRFKRSGELSPLAIRLARVSLGMEEVEGHGLLQRRAGAGALSVGWARDDADDNAVISGEIVDFADIDQGHQRNSASTANPRSTNVAAMTKNSVRQFSHAWNLSDAALSQNRRKGP